MKRFFFLLSTCILIVSLFVVTAFGAVVIEIINYNDYITEVVLSDDKETIKLSFPDTGVWFTSGSNSDITEQEFSYMTSSYPNRYIFYDPFRNPQNHILTFRRSDFPADTVFTFAFSCSTENLPKVGYLRYEQYDKQGNSLGTTKTKLRLDLAVDSAWDTYVTVSNESLTFLPECYSFSFKYEFTAQGVESTTADGDTVYWYNFRYRDFACQFSIDSLLRQQQLSQTTNSLLSAVEDKLAENGIKLDGIQDSITENGEKLDDIEDTLTDNGDKLDTIINGEVAPTPPAGGESVGDLDDMESGLRDDSQAGLDDSLAMQQSALQIFQQYSVAFLVVGDLFTSFADIPFFSFLLYISVALGIFGLLVNLGVDASLASSDAKKRDQKHRNRQIIKKSRGK